jgi:hypothetical protein
MTYNLLGGGGGQAEEKNARKKPAQLPRGPPRKQVSLAGASCGPDFNSREQRIEASQECTIPTFLVRMSL